MPPTPERRQFRLSLRTLFIALVFVGGFLKFATTNIYTAMAVGIWMAGVAIFVSALVGARFIARTYFGRKRD